MGVVEWETSLRKRPEWKGQVNKGSPIPSMRESAAQKDKALFMSVREAVSTTLEVRDKTGRVGR